MDGKRTSNDTVPELYLKDLKQLLPRVSGAHGILCVRMPRVEKPMVVIEKPSLKGGSHG